MSQRAEVFTIGVEEEYQIIDPLTRELSAEVDRIFPVAQKELGDVVQYELMLSQIEIATPVCHTLADVQAELRRSRRAIISAAAQEGKKIAAAGTHPFSRWRDQPITPRERYQLLADEYQQLVREQVIFGCHVHVGINDREMAVEVLNRARVWLPILLAITANSPYWEGEETEYSSFRAGLWWTSPVSGPPPLFNDRAEYEALVRALVATRCLVDETRIYWDIRLPHRFPTIEFRVMDVCMSVNETVMLAGLVRALVQTCYEEALREEPFPAIHGEVLRGANWRAARYGMDAELIDVDAFRTVPARDLIARFLAYVRPALEAWGDWERVSVGMQELLLRGNGAMRQREVYRRTGRLEDVVDFVVAETAKDL